MNNEFGLPDKTVEVLLNYFRSKPEIEKVMVYGSRAKGCWRNGSDIDFAVWTDNSSGIFKIWAELEDLSTPYKFDVTDYKTLTHEGLKNSIDTDGKLFYKK